MKGKQKHKKNSTRISQMEKRRTINRKGKKNRRDNRINNKGQKGKCFINK